MINDDLSRMYVSKKGILRRAFMEASRIGQAVYVYSGDVDAQVIGFRQYEKDQTTVNYVVSNVIYDGEDDD